MNHLFGDLRIGDQFRMINSVSGEPSGPIYTKIAPIFARGRSLTARSKPINPNRPDDFWSVTDGTRVHLI